MSVQGCQRSVPTPWTWSRLLVGTLGALCVLASFPGQAQAAVITWDGGGTDATCGGAVGSGNNWSCAANWVGDVAPGTADVATFDTVAETR